MGEELFIILKTNSNIPLIPFAKIWKSIYK